MHAKRFNRFLALLISVSIIITCFNIVIPLTAYSEGEEVEISEEPTITPNPSELNIEKEATYSIEAVVTTSEGIVFDTTTGTITDYIGNAGNS